MTSELLSMAGSAGITGLCFHRGTEILHHSLPDIYGDAAAAELCQAVVSAFIAYAGAERPLTQSYFQYPENGVLVLTSPPADRTHPDPATDFFLTFLVSDPAALPAIIAPARGFLTKQARGA